jgi:hypothetical protein
MYDEFYSRRKRRENSYTAIIKFIAILLIVVAGLLGAIGFLSNMIGV